VAGRTLAPPRPQDVGSPLLFRRGRRRDVLVELARLRLGQVLVGERLDDHLLPPSAGAGDGQPGAGAQFTVRLGRALAVDLDLAAVAGPLRFRAGLEEAGDIE